MCRDITRRYHRVQPGRYQRRMLDHPESGYQLSKILIGGNNTYGRMADAPRAPHTAKSTDKRSILMIADQ